MLAGPVLLIAAPILERGHDTRPNPRILTASGRPHPAMLAPQFGQNCASAFTARPQFRQKTSSAPRACGDAPDGDDAGNETGGA